MTYRTYLTASALALLMSVGVAGAQDGDTKARVGGEIRGGAETGDDAVRSKARGKAEAEVQTRGDNIRVQGSGEAKGDAQIREGRGAQLQKPDSDGNAATQAQPRVRESSGDAKEQSRERQAPDRAEEPREPRDQERAGKRDQDEPDARAGASASAEVNLTREQRERIRTSVFQNRRYQRQSRVDFSVRIGIRVPQYVVLHPLPVIVVDYMPAYNGYLFFIIGGQLVIVHPATHEIVAVVLLA
jgi:hypothetical protein